MDMSHITEVMAIKLRFLPILAKHWLPWQRSSDPCNQKYLLWIGRPRTPPLYVTTFSLSLAEVHLCAFIATSLIYRTEPKTGKVRKRTTDRNR